MSDFPYRQQSPIGKSFSFLHKHLQIWRVQAAHDIISQFGRSHSEAPALHPRTLGSSDSIYNNNCLESQHRGTNNDPVSSEVDCELSRNPKGRHACESASR